METEHIGLMMYCIISLKRTAKISMLSGKKQNFTLSDIYPSFEEFIKYLMAGTLAL